MWKSSSNTLKNCLKFGTVPNIKIKAFLNLHMDSRRLTDLCIWAAVGNGLALLSTELGSFHPQIALDLSHFATLLIALRYGSLMGGIEGILISIIPYFRFGIQGFLGPIAGLLFFPGKMLTGLTVGFLKRRFRPLISVVTGYIPEFIFTFLSLRYIVRLFVPPEAAGVFTLTVIAGILAKAWFEMGILSIIMEFLSRRLNLATT